jgi:erythronate-4-phosphate dehydrogenase
MNVVIDSDIPFLRGVLEEHAHVVYREGRTIRREHLLDTDALVIRTRTKCDRSLLEGTRVRFIASATIGYDHIDTEYCREAGIAWTNAPGCNSASVQQYVGAALVSLSRTLHRPLTEMTIGVIGVGHVGTKVAALCRALGMQVLQNDPPRARTEGAGAFVDLQTLVDRSDILTLHVPLNRSGPDATMHLFDTRLLSLLRPAQLLLNTSRGEVVDTQALSSCLAAKGLAGCVLDVWEGEPAIDRLLLNRVDIATPHIAGYSADGKANGTAMSVRALAGHFGLPLLEWTPRELPPPSQPIIDIDGRGRTSEDIMHEAVLHSYDIGADDDALRQSPETFEAQRAHYPVRREFHAFHVSLRRAPAAAGEGLKLLGFHVIHQ